MRLPYTANPPTFNDLTDQAFLERILKARGKHGLSPLDLSLLHSPTFFKGFMQFFTSIRTKSTLPEDIMELAMCRVGALNGAAFEWMHHMPLLKKAGVSEEGIETVRTVMPNYVGTNGEKGLSKRLWTVMRYVDAMTKDVKVSDEVFEGVRAMLDERQMVELTLTCAGYNAVSRFLLAMDVAEMKDIKVGDAKLPSKL
ncbi:4-carboxymuconolactone decarboxylase family protein [Tothia fuscella]|uniref:4-carboxymuconolactone decarboxylase family protein n=1 Tax=Tothia fuscella TaxID=1048955 RepID=A0A9P4NFA8_9PEZI|nr:4-carboxymuconolactone decarboxylase family protein [Tothia fuscella]